MSYIVKTLIGVMAYLLLASTADAQILDRLRNRAQQAAEDRVEQRLSEEVERAAEQMVDRTWESIFGDGIISANGERRSIPFSLNSNATTEDAYHFNIVTTMEIEIVNEDGEAEPPMTMRMHFNDSELYTGTGFTGEDMEMEDGEVFIIYDFKNSAMVMLMESEDGKFSFAYDWTQMLEIIEERADEEDWEEYEEWEGFTRIGTKTILGYQAEGFESRSEYHVSEMWVTRDAAYGMENMFQAHANAKQLGNIFPDDFPHGMILELVNEDLESGEKSTMRVTDIRENANVTYQMSDYPVFGFQD
jgi:hypothetical protein